MYLCRGGEWGDGGWDIALQKFFCHVSSQTGHAKGHFELQTSQNAAKSIPDITIHLAGCFQPVGHL